MKCPYCNEDLKEWDRRLYCENMACSANHEDLPKFIWQDLIDGKKAQRQLQTVKDLCVKRGQTIVRCKRLQEYALDVFDICSNIKYRHIPNYQELEPSKVKEKLRIVRISAVKQYFRNRGDINDKMV